MQTLSIPLAIIFFQFGRGIGSVVREVSPPLSIVVECKIDLRTYLIRIETIHIVPTKSQQFVWYIY